MFRLVAKRPLCPLHTSVRRQSVSPALASKFDVIETRHVPELAVQATLFRHRQTNADVMSLRAPDDANKVFGIAFRTPPTDSSGVAHILEHSVLCGSRKYPVKEPFVELMKSSLQVRAVGGVTLAVVSLGGV
jgi:hypothetical protein